MKTKLSWIKAIFIVLFLGAFAACDEDSEDPGINPFSNGGDARNMIVVFSDMHLGADTAYSECVANRGPLVTLLGRIQAAPNVRELVIGGDLADEWLVPATTDTYQGGDQGDFMERLAGTNKEVFDTFNSIIQEGQIRVTFLPGNHDLAITEASIDRVLPGINQARDEALGVGTYTPVDCPKIAIEHGHRYNFLCSPDPFSNQDIAPGTVMPPSYFFTRLVALSQEQSHPVPVDTLPVVLPYSAPDESQALLFKYWKICYETVMIYPNTYRFDEKMIVTNVNGLTGNFSVNDIVPFQLTPGGIIDVTLFKGIQDQWEARQASNEVPVHIPVDQAMDSAMSNSEVDRQAKNQYFLNPASDKRIVIFGHTHEAKIIESVNSHNEKCIYANSGTWLDKNMAPTTMNFIVITPQDDDAASQTEVKLYNFEKEAVTLMASSSLRY